MIRLVINEGPGVVTGLMVHEQNTETSNPGDGAAILHRHSPIGFNTAMATQGRGHTFFRSR